MDLNAIFVFGTHDSYEMSYDRCQGIWLLVPPPELKKSPWRRPWLFVILESLTTNQQKGKMSLKIIR